MHNKTIITTLFALTILLASCSTNPEKIVLHDQQDTLSWVMGMSLAQTAQSGFYQFDEDVIKKAFENTIAGGEQPIDDETYQSTREYITFLVEKHQHEQDQISSLHADSLQQEYFARLLAQKPNLKRASKGYYYEVLREGKGPRAQIGMRIKLDFKSTNMLTGDLIEQTFGTGHSIVHVLDSPMFEGLLDGMQLMNAGSLYRFYFPYQLVKGTNGVPPYTPVVYEVELHEIYND